MESFSLSDSTNLLSKLTPKRVWNATLVLSSYYVSKWTKKPVQWGYPMSIGFEPTTSCNLRCPECPSGLREFTRPTGMLEKNLFQKTIDEISSQLMYLIFYFQGEPYLNPGFLDMVQYARKKGIYTATSTNAHYLTEANARKTVESGLDRLIISIDGTTQDTYEQYRVGGNLEKVIEGARNMVKVKRELKSKTPLIIFQFLVVKPNEHQIEDVKKLAKEIGVDQVRFKTAQVYDYANGNPLIPTIDRYSRYRKNKEGQFEPKISLSNHCWRLWHNPVITWDGLIVPCCFDKDAEHKLGDLKNATFQEIWNNKAYKDFRGAVLHSRENINICTNCSEGATVWA